MNRDDITRLARQAGATTSCINDEVWMLVLPETGFEQFANLVAAAEREACADIAENWNCNGMPRYGVANAIRERGAP